MRYAPLMVILAALAALAGISAPPCAHARTATAAERKTCEQKVQRKIDTIDSRMRAGYSAAQGEALKQRRRMLERERADCRYTR